MQMKDQIDSQDNIAIPDEEKMTNNFIDEMED